MKKQLSRRAALGLALAGAASPGLAQTSFPNRAVSIIVPFPPGGATDLIARPYGAALQRHWNQSVVLQNRGGAGGALGMNAGATAIPVEGLTTGYLQALACPTGRSTRPRPLRRAAVSSR